MPNRQSEIYSYTCHLVAVVAPERVCPHIHLSRYGDLVGELVEIPVRSWLVLEVVFVILWGVAWVVIATPAGDDGINSDIGNAQPAWVVVIVCCGWLLTIVCNWQLADSLWITTRCILTLCKYFRRALILDSLTTHLLLNLRQRSQILKFGA